MERASGVIKLEFNYWDQSHLRLRPVPLWHLRANGEQLQVQLLAGILGQYVRAEEAAVLG